MIDPGRRALWSEVRSFVERFARDGYTGVDAAFVKRRDEASPELVPHLDLLVKWLRNEDPPNDEEWKRGPLSVLLAVVPDSEGPLWKLLGPRLYADALLASTAIATRWEWNLPAGYIVSIDPEAKRSTWALKSRLTEASAETIAICKEVATLHWASGGIGTKMSIAYAFQDEDPWRREAIDMFLANPSCGIPSWTVSSIVRDVDQATRMIEAFLHSDYEAIARNVGVAIAPVLAKRFASTSRYGGESFAKALALLDAPEAAEALASCLGRPYQQAIAAAYFEKNTEHGRAALRKIADGNSHAARMAEDLLDRLERGVDTAASSIVDATPEELPAVLRDPPWRRPAHERRKPTRTIPGLTITASAPEEVLVSDDVAKRGADALVMKVGSTPSTEELRAEWEKSAGPYDNLHVAYPYILGRLGVSGITGALAIVERVPSLALHIDSPRLAPIVAKRISSSDPDALRWFHLHPRSAVLGLIPSLSDDDPVSWRVFGRMVREEILSREEIGALVRQHYPSHVVGLIEERIDFVLTHDPVALYPDGPPKLEGVVVEMLDRPLLRTRKRLPLDAFRALLELLSITSASLPLPSIQAVRAACSPQSLAALSWDLACIWETRQRGTGRRRYSSYDNYRWMLGAVALFGDDEIARRLTPRMSGVPIIETLSCMATDAAVLELLTIYAREMASKGKKHLDVCEHHIVMATTTRGLTSDELEETLLPDPVKSGAVLVDGKLMLDYGPRQFELRWAEDLRPCLVIEKGAIVKRMPAVRQTDDKEKVERAKAAWATITEDVGAIIVRRVELLRRRRDERRSFTLAELRAHYIDPPLLAALARGLLFVRAADPRTAFRVAEDRTFADVHDMPVIIDDPNEPIRLARFDDLSPEDRDAWRTLFLDYEIITPLSQLEDPSAVEAPT